jgi:hypothetical protein
VDDEDALPGLVDVGNREAARAGWLVNAVRGSLAAQAAAEFALLRPIQVLSLGEAVSQRGFADVRRRNGLGWLAA